VWFFLAMVMVGIMVLLCLIFPSSHNLNPVFMFWPPNLPTLMSSFLTRSHRRRAGVLFFTADGCCVPNFVFKQALSIFAACNFFQFVHLWSVFLTWFFCSYVFAPPPVSLYPMSDRCVSILFLTFSYLPCSVGLLTFFSIFFFFLV